MLDEENESDMNLGKPDEEHKKRRRPVVIKIPRREKSVEIPPPKVLVMTASIKPGPIKLRQCLVSPLTLYEIAAAVVDELDYPQPFEWNEVQVAEWMGEVVGLPQYKKCIIDNHINGRRLLRLEDPSALPEINIHYFEHIKKITAAVRKVFVTDYVLFARSVGLPFRKPLTYCKWFKSRTGPSWGIRQNWTRSDILRWMKIILPKPVYLDHWDLVWYLKPDWPKQMLARIPKAELSDEQKYLPQYIPAYEVCNEYLAPRKFKILRDVPSNDQYIWMEHRQESPGFSPGSRSLSSSSVESKKRKSHEEKDVGQERKAARARIMPKPISLAGLAGLVGKDLILARRKMAKPKFLP